MKRIILFCFLGLLTTAENARAQYTWSGGDGSWSDGANWTGGVPMPGDGTVINLVGTAPPTAPATYQDLANPFQVNQLNMLVDASSGFVVGGGQLQFTGTLPTLYSEAAALLHITAPIDFTVNTAINPTANNPAGAEFQLSGALTAAPGITVSVGSGSSPPAAMVVIDGTNYGFAGTWAVTSNTITQIQGVNALSRAADVTLSGTQSTFTVGTTADSGLADSGTGIQLKAISGNGQFQVGTTNSASTALVGFGNGDFTLSSGGTLASGNAGSQFAKVGTGTFTDSGSQAKFVGSVSVRDGLFNLTGSTAVSGGFGTASTGPITVYAGAELRETLTGTGSNGRIGTAQNVILNGGTLRLDASGMGTTGTGFSEVLGSLNVGAGQSIVRIDTAANRGARFNFTSLAQVTNTGTVFFQSGNLGGAVLSTAGSGNVAFGTSPTLVGGDGSTATNLKILPYGFAATSSTGSPATLVTYDGTNASIRGLADTNYAASFGVDTDNVSLNAAASLSAATTANAVRLTAGGSTDLNGNNLTITSGALLNNNGGDVTATGGGTLNFGAGGATTAYITTNGTMNISSGIAATNLSKNGAGELVLGGPVTLASGAGNGVLAVNAGKLTLGAGANVGSVQQFQVSRGATLSGDLVVSSGQSLTGAGTVHGNTTLSGGTVTPSALGGPGSTLASPGTLTVDGNLTVNGGSSYQWFVSSAVTDTDGTSPYTASLLKVTGTLDLSGASPSNQIKLQLVSLGLSNAAGPVYDLNPTGTQSWVIAQAGSINGFSAGNIVIDTSNFANLQGADNPFVVSQVGNTLVLTFSPVPEPATVLAVATAALGGGAFVRRRWRGAAANAELN